MNRRLGTVTLIHATLGSFGDLETSVFNLMNVPLEQFLNQSITKHYGPPTQETFSFCLSTIASLFYVGTLVGAFIMGWLMESLGRKNTAIIVRSSLGVASGVCMFIAKPLMSFELFAIGHFLAGVINAFKIVLFIYMTECSPDHLRGLTSMAMSSGGLLALLITTPLCLPAVLGNSEHWMYLPVAAAIIAFLHLLIAAQFPPSPKHLFIHHHAIAASKVSILYYHGSGADFEAIEEEYDRERLLLSKGHTSLSEVFANRTLRWSLAIVMFCAFVPSTSAINIKNLYQANILMSFGFDNTQVMFALMAVSILASPMCFLSPIIIERLGRRPLFLSVSALCIAEWFLLGTAQFTTDHINAPVIFSEVLGVVGSVCGSLASMLGLLVFTAIMIGELCPHPSRAVFTQFSTVVSILFATVSVQIYPISVEMIGFGYHLTMLILSATCFIFLYRFLPETKGLPVDEIVKHLSCEHRCPEALLTSEEGMLAPSYGTLTPNSNHNSIT